MGLDKYWEGGKRIAIFNCREDRPERSQQLSEVVPHWKAADVYILVGTGTYIFAKFAEKAGLNPQNIVLAEGQSASQVFETIIENSDQKAFIMGMGNIGGVGLEIIQYFKNRSFETIAWGR